MKRQSYRQIERSERSERSVYYNGWGPGPALGPAIWGLGAKPLVYQGSRGRSPRTHGGLVPLNAIGGQVLVLVLERRLYITIFWC